VSGFDLKTTVKKADLLVDLKKQAKEHQAAYERALVNWRKAMREEAQAVLDAGDKLDRYPKRLSNLMTTPVCYLREINDIISMLELSSDVEITLTHADFRKFVLGKDWSWSYNFRQTNSSYGAWDDPPPPDDNE
jgi:hypothetical protein